MFSWLRRNETSADPQQAAELYESVRSHLQEGDEDSVIIIASVAALLLCIAYADSDYDSREEAVLRATLGRMHGMDQAGVESIMSVLREKLVRITGAEATTYARELLNLTDDDFRVQLLDLLLAVAAADDNVTVSETNILRDVTKALGLSQATYLKAQSVHRDKLAVLRRERS